MSVLHSVSQKHYTCQPAQGNESDLLLYWNISRLSLTSQHLGSFTTVSISIPVKFILSRSSKVFVSKECNKPAGQHRVQAGPRVCWGLEGQGPVLAMSYRVRGSRCFDRWTRTGTKGGSQGRPGKASSLSPMWMWSNGHWWKTRWITSTCLTPPPQVVAPLRAHRYLSLSSLVFVVFMTDPQCSRHMPPRVVLQHCAQEPSSATQSIHTKVCFYAYKWHFSHTDWRSIISGEKEVLKVIALGIRWLGKEK